MLYWQDSITLENKNQVTCNKSRGPGLRTLFKERCQNLLAVKNKTRDPLFVMLFYVGQIQVPLKTKNLVASDKSREQGLRTYCLKRCQDSVTFENKTSDQSFVFEVESKV